MVVRDGLRLTVIGIGIGLALAVLMQRAVASLVYGVGTADPLTFATVSALLVSVALASSALPAWRAAQVDPTVTLRDE
jgi:ABC-type antimicrobial peptide transport system permease subunit